MEFAFSSWSYVFSKNPSSVVAMASSPRKPRRLSSVGVCRPQRIFCDIVASTCSATCDATAERTPCSPAAIDMKNVNEPKQWTTICTESFPVSFFTVSTAAG